MRGLRLLALGAAFVVMLHTAGAAGADGVSPLSFSPVHDLGVVEADNDVFFEVPLKNASARTVRIISVEPSCGCTEVSVTEKEIGPGEQAMLKGRIDTTGKMGKVVKTVDITTDSRPGPLTLKITFFVKHSPGPSDKTAIFRGGCARCHVGRDIQSKSGETLFHAVCYMCHKDYSSLGRPGGEAIRNAVSNGVPGTSMPGFEKSAGGPLTKGQVSSLVEFLKGDN